MLNSVIPLILNTVDLLQLYLNPDIHRGKCNEGDSSDAAELKKSTALT